MPCRQKSNSLLYSCLSSGPLSYHPPVVAVIKGTIRWKYCYSLQNQMFSHSYLSTHLLFLRQSSGFGLYSPLYLPFDEHSALGKSCSIPTGEETTGWFLQECKTCCRKPAGEGSLCTCPVRKVTCSHGSVSSTARDLETSHLL